MNLDLTFKLNLLSQGLAKLPLDILLNIAGFVAGSNHYGTLLAFCYMSKRIKKETESIFYETVLISEVEDLHRESGSQKLLNTYRFTKYVHGFHNDIIH